MQTIISTAPRYDYTMPMLAEELDPYEHRLLGHYLSLGANSDESLETTAAACKMSVSKTREARESLERLGYLKCTTPTKSEAARGISTRIELQDRHVDNLEYVAAKASSDLAVLPETVEEAQPDLAVLAEQLRENLEAQPDLAVLPSDARARILDSLLLSLKAKVPGPIGPKDKDKDKEKKKDLKDLSSQSDDEILASHRAWMDAVCVAYRLKAGPFPGKLIAYFQGRGTGKWGDFKIDGEVTAPHVEAFGAYWRMMYGDTPIPTKPETIQHHFEAFLAHERSDTAVRVARERLLKRIKPAQETKMAPADPEKIAEFFRKRDEIARLASTPRG